MLNLVTAQESKKLANSYNDTKYKANLNKMAYDIRTASSKGLYHIRIEFIIENEDIDELMKLGYVVQHKTISWDA